jgi:hypothetical protein
LGYAAFPRPLLSLASFVVLHCPGALPAPVTDNKNRVDAGNQSKEVHDPIDIDRQVELGIGCEKRYENIKAAFDRMDIDRETAVYVVYTR